MFLYENLFFSISSVISIPVMLIGINGGYFPAICRVCLINFIGVIFEAGNETREKIWSDFGGEQK